MKFEHFKGKFEVELKYRVQSATNFKRMLSSMPHQVRFEDNTEYDWYYDTPNNTLHHNNKSLIIREIEPCGIKLWIVKGPGDDCCESINITDSQRAKSMLETMGYDVSLIIKKKRSIYFINEYHVTLDYLEGLGEFAEFAIMTDDESMLDYYRDELKKLANLFELTDKEQEHNSYRTLKSQQLLSQ